MLGEQVAVRVHFQLALEDGSVRFVADSDKNAVKTKLAGLLRFGAAQAHAFDDLLRSEDLLDDERSDEFDFLVFPGAVDHDFRSAKLFAAVKEIDLACVTRKKVGFLHRGVAAAYHRDGFSPKEIAVASRASGNATADQLPLSFQTEQTCRGARGDDQGFRFVGMFSSGDFERSLVKIDFCDGSGLKFRTEFLRLLAHVLIENMRKQAQKFGAEFKAGAVTEVDLHKRPFKITAGKHTYETEALIVAAGASARLLGLKGERELIGRGVSTCATCDGYFFRGKPIAVVGGGDSAMEEANFLSRYASRVYLVHRRKEFRASKIMIDRARKNEKIEFVTPFVVEQILAPQEVVEGVRLRSTESKETRELGLDGVFVAVGHEPNTTVFKGKLEMDSNGYLLAKHGSLTSIPGVFVAGDVQDHRYRQAVTAAGSGCMAAIDAEKFLEEHKG